MQVYELSSMHFLPKEWIMERWEDGFYITAMAGSAGGSSLVVMSKGTPYTQQSYKVCWQAETNREVGDDHPSQLSQKSNDHPSAQSLSFLSAPAPHSNLLFLLSMLVWGH